MMSLEEALGGCQKPDEVSKVLADAICGYASVGAEDRVKFVMLGNYAAHALSEPAFGNRSGYSVDKVLDACSLPKIVAVAQFAPDSEPRQAVAMAESLLSLIHAEYDPTEPRQSDVVAERHAGLVSTFAAILRRNG